jgi:signal transduction histidine kinase/ActR/RegA family two-component response regulator
MMTSQQFHPCLAGGGEAGALMRSIDWAKNPLGPVESWPRSLQTIVSIMLASRFAMRVMWGPEFLLLYNDSYQPVLGSTKLPGAMGSPTVSSFSEVWDVVGPMFQRVYAGEAVAMEDGLLCIDRHGYLEECYFTLSYSPIRDEAGLVAGLLGVVHETTKQVLADRRFATLERLAASAAQARTVEEACEAAAQAIAKNTADVPFALFYLLSADGKRARLVSATGLPANSSAAPAQLELVESAASWPIHLPLIEDLLDVSRIISGKVRLDVQNVDFGQVLEAALDSARPALDAKQIDVRAVIDSNGGMVMGDANRLQQVAWNLLANAAKFTNKGGSVRVVLSRVDSQLELSITDTGKGIAADFLPLVFDRFKQADSTTTRQHGGLGLGLAIAKNLVEMHGGTIRAQSEGEGLGATFVVLLPVSAMHHRSRVTPVTASFAQLNLEYPPELVGLRVLVVDDEEDARDLVITLLEHCGVLVEAASSATQALHLIQHNRPDVLISDIGMPVEDGYSLIRRVRLLPIDAGGATPAASLTAYAGIEDRRRAMMAGFNMHLPKPVDPSELVAVVTNLARLSKAIARS